ncbi:MAG: ABC transporter ATP-binding protein [Chloroflexi bacterium]|nr:ABC transporter ATP-binding protein [Chloroflexota bacterium]
MIRLENLSKVYSTGALSVPALTDVNLTIQSGEMAAIMGPSGSGKSTLMNILGCLDQSTSGAYYLSGVNVSTLSERQLAVVRNRQIGFVFQSYNLLRRTSAVDNVELPLIYAGVRNRRRRAEEALERVGLKDRMHHRSNELSGGEQQRVAIARAVINNPEIILADEPTGNLDTRTGLEIISLFQKLNRESGITVLYVTHSAETAEYTERIIRLTDGRLISDEPVPDPRIAVSALDR